MTEQVAALKNEKVVKYGVKFLKVVAVLGVVAILGIVALIPFLPTC